jgi:acetamidase/formamidase
MKFLRPFQHLAVAVMTLFGSAAVPHIGQTAEFTLMPSPQTVHIGHFASNLKPVLSIESGDTVTIETSALFAPEIIDQSGVVPPSAIPQYQRDIFREVKDRGPSGHVLTGPIEIRGAMPGDVLEVRILEVELALDWGVNRQRPYVGVLPDEFTALWMRVIPINRQTKTAEVGRGVVVPVDKPFFGTMGVAPDATLGRISGGPSGVHTGNLDNKDLIAGTTLYMPVHVAGALFSVGDAHAAQGHGEVDITAIETGLRGKFQFIVRKDMRLLWPRAETPTHWVVMGLNPDLDDAMKIAVRETIDLITKRFPHLTREETYMIASVAVDYHVTQAVDAFMERFRKRSFKRNNTSSRPSRIEPPSSVLWQGWVRIACGPLRKGLLFAVNSGSHAGQGSALTRPIHDRMP